MIHSPAHRSPRGVSPTEEEGTVGILALQGSFGLHQKALRRLGVATRLVRVPEHLDDLSGLVIPGGESTVMSLLAREYGLFEPLRCAAREGLAIMGTCAGAILLGQGDGDPPRLGVVPLRLRRNAYGSQSDSFTAELRIDIFDETFHGVFIRAPVILPAPPAAAFEDAPVRVLGRHEGQVVLAQSGDVLLTTFHPELTDDLRLHRYFLTLCRRSSSVPRSGAIE